MITSVLRMSCVMIIHDIQCFCCVPAEFACVCIYACVQVCVYLVLFVHVLVHMCVCFVLVCVGSDSVHIYILY